MSSRLAFLKSLPVFAPLSDDDLARIDKETIELTIPKKGTLFIEGDPCKGLYIVKSGQIRVFKSSADGREQVLLIANPGDSLNDVPTFDGGPNAASGSAVDSSVIYLIPKELLLSLLKDSPMALAIIKLFASRLRRMTMLVEDLSFRSVVSRLAKILLDLAVSEEQPSLIRRLTQDEMAAMVGTVRDVVSRALRTLDREGAISIQGHRILIKDVDKLKDFI